MGNHFIKKCGCGAVITQCRCMGEKTATFSICDKCKANDIPRRVDLRRHTAAELAIRTAVEEVEKLGASVILTDAVNLLSQAREKVADYIDG